jgi:2-desacetyl-2-hydroxyethyl bacteriochlorophyllide A dehydrogenase
MKAKALITDSKQNFSIEDLTLSDPRPTDLVVACKASGVSIGTEFALIQNKLSWGPYPLCTGYQATGVVEWKGSAVEGFAVGDRVYYRANQAQTSALKDGTAVSMVSGTHCSHAIVDTTNVSHGPALLPKSADLEVSSLFVMPAVGLYGVDMSQPQMGDTVVVHGVGQIGLGVVAACVHRGCIVVAVDIDEAKLAMASAFGASHVIDSSKTDLEEAVRKISTDGADVVFECTGIPSLIDNAIKLCRPHGKFIWQGNYGGGDVSMHFLTPHTKRLRMFFPCDDGGLPCRDAVLRNMVHGYLPWEKVITDRVSSTDAPALYSAINRGDSTMIGGVIRWE